MTLSAEDAKLYYQLWLPLLDYVNRKYKVVRGMKNIPESDSIDPMGAKKIADTLWENTEVIDSFLKDNPDLPGEHREILRSWKRRVIGDFLMERHLKKGTIFISVENGEVYQVQGIISTWEEMFPGYPLPMVVRATFIPFRDVIISDGLVIPYTVGFGGGMKKLLKERYMEVKQSGGIHRSL